MSKVYCKGSISLGTGCTKCSRCKEQIEAGVKPMITRNRPSMRDIPVAAAERIAKDYGYDQVVIFARRISNPLPPINEATALPEDGQDGEHLTTYGTNPTHCAVAATMGNVLKSFMRWPDQQDYALSLELLVDLDSGVFDYSDYDDTIARVAALRRVLHAR